jgi:hypothetical protein
LDDTGLFGGTLAHGGDVESQGVFLFFQLAQGGD